MGEQLSSSTVDTGPDVTDEAGSEASSERPGRRSGEPTTGTAAGSAPGGWRRWPRRLVDAGWPAQVAVSAVVLGVMMHLRFGYAIGIRDHLVLAPVGMRWAHPDWFVGDWAMANAPQPHLLFDTITWFGFKTGTIAVVYFLYWVASLVAFGAATTLLARTWTPRFSWAAVLTVTIGSALTPLYVLGSGSALFPTPLPNVLGGCLIYLTAAALLTGRHRLAAAAGVVAAVVHVQHGAIVFLLMVALAGAVFLRERRVDRALLLGAGGALAIVVTLLRIRPVAGDTKTFQEACQLLIPYHCEATSWTREDFYGGLAVIMLVLLIVGYLPAGQRFRWFVIVAVPASALFVGAACDRLDIPVFGELAQGLFIYRLALLLTPFLAWAALLPVFGDLPVRWRWLSLGLVMAIGSFALRVPSWGLDHHPSFWGPSGRKWGVPVEVAFPLGLVAAVAAWTVPGLVPRPRWLIRAGAATVVMGMLVSATLGNILLPTRPNLGFFPVPALAAWGRDVQKAVPPGEQLLIPPSALDLRMAMRRGVVVDCKYGPYGGDAWREYRRRIEALGGFRQCFSGIGYGYLKLTAPQLQTVARDYGADYVVLSVSQQDARSQLAGDGWTVVVSPASNVPYEVFRAPWA